jgi:ATP-dependent Clp protease ATP-binding subunit ClpA
MAIEFIDDGDKGKKKDGGTPVLDNFSKDLIKAAEQGKLDPVIGRQKEILRIAQVLSRRKKITQLLLVNQVLVKRRLLKVLQ